MHDPHSILLIAITGIGPIVPEAFSVAELRAAGPSLGGARTSAHSMSHFAPERFLGRRGFKFLSPAARYALAAAQVALEDAGLRDTALYEPESRGVIVGTNFAVHDVADAMDRVVLSQGSDALLAIETPNFSVNIPASYVSLKFGFLAFNITLTNMLVAGVEAVVLGAQSIQEGRAKLVLAGATEGAIPERGAALLGGTASDGGACLLVLESSTAARSRGAHAYAEVGSSLLCFIPPDAAGTAALWAPHDRRLRRHLDSLLGNRTLLSLAMLDLDCPVVQRVNETVLRHLDDRHVTAHRYPLASVAASEASVSPVLWLGASIAQHGEGLLLTVSPQGHVAALSLEPAGSQRGCTIPVAMQVPVASGV